jgi:ATP-dependent RNA helicase DOB1
MGIQEPELVDLVHKLEDLEQKQCSHRLHKVYIARSLHH